MIDALNDPEVLDDTPIGTLRVIEWGDTACVAIMDPHDNERVSRIVHTLQPGENPLNAVYGKRRYESAAIGLLYEKRADVVAASAQREHDLQRKDFRKRIAGFLGRYHDAREAVAERIGVTA